MILLQCRDCQFLASFIFIFYTATTSWWHCATKDGNKLGSCWYVKHGLDLKHAQCPLSHLWEQSLNCMHYLKSTITTKYTSKVNRINSNYEFKIEVIYLVEYILCYSAWFHLSVDQYILKCDLFHRKFSAYLSWPNWALTFKRQMCLWPCYRKIHVTWRVLFNLIVRLSKLWKRRRLWKRNLSQCRKFPLK